jgi:hypothetical protein
LGKHWRYARLVNGINREETFDSNRHGFQIAVAAQVGEADPATGFVKYPWLPSMNSPVFSVDSKFGESKTFLIDLGNVGRRNARSSNYVASLAFMSPITLASLLLPLTFLLATMS